MRLCVCATLLVARCAASRALHLCGCFTLNLSAQVQKTMITLDRACFLNHTRMQPVTFGCCRPKVLKYAGTMAPMTPILLQHAAMLALQVLY